ncbi:MAG: FeoB-associated Cys-rich membrane protein [Clostridia bacterium]|nr:FeoB-associated Cys-rich membrane protein [Clostridia bacterium]
MSWFTNNLGSILIGGVVLLLVAGAVFVLVRNKKKGKSSCGCGCANCAMKGSCHKG